MHGTLPDPHPFPQAQPYSREFWMQMVRLGGTVEQVAASLPSLTAKEIAGHLAEAHAAIVREEAITPALVCRELPAKARRHSKTVAVLTRPNCRDLESNWDKHRL